MVQVPTALGVTVVPLTLHTLGVVVVKVTPKLDVAVAAQVAVALNLMLVGSQVKFIVWLALVTTIFLVTCGAAKYTLSPAWLAATVQVPVATAVTVLVATLHTLGVALVNVTGNPELAVALALVVPP
jgi:hypothetical protein